MITVRSDAPFSVAQLLPAASISGVMPSVGELAVEPLTRLPPHRTPRQALRAIGGRGESAPVREDSSTTSCALIARQYISSTDYTDCRSDPETARQFSCDAGHRRAARSDRRFERAAIHGSSIGRRRIARPEGLPRLLAHPCNPCNLWTCLYARARSSSPELHAASVTRSRCAPPPTAPTSSSPRRRPSRIRSCRARFTRRPRTSKRRAARRWPSPTDIRDEAQVDAAIAAAVDALRRHRHPRQQRLGDQPHRHARHADEALRPDASDQHARHVPLHAEGRAASGEILESARPQHLAAAAFDAQPALVRAARRLHDGEVRHVAVRARHGGGVPSARHRRQRAVAADRDRHRGDPVDRRTGSPREDAQSADHGRRGPLDPHAAKPQGHRPLLPGR